MPGLCKIGLQTARLTKKGADNALSLIRRSRRHDSGAHVEQHQACSGEQSIQPSIPTQSVADIPPSSTLFREFTLFKLRPYVAAATLVLAAACSDETTGPDISNVPSLSRGAEGGDLPATLSLVLRSDTIQRPRYIVRLNDDVEAPEQVAEALAREVSGSVIYVYQRVFKGFNVALPNEEAAAQLRRLPGVADVVVDEKIEPTSSQSTSNWGLDRIDKRSGLNNTYNYFYNGSGVNVYIIDSGVQGTHSEFSGRFGSLSFTSQYPNNPYQDCNGHGTMVASIAAGTVVGVAKGATIHPLQVFPCSGNANSGDIASAIDFVVEYGPRPAVINLSLGQVKNWYDIWLPVESAVTAALADGVHVVMAAGNNGIEACDFSPARLTAGITVGASDSYDDRVDEPLWESNYGSCVDLFAPGLDVDQAIPSGTYNSGGAGTSAAAPYVTGTVALILSQISTLSPSYIQKIIKDSSSKGRLSNIGSGSPNNLLYAPHTFISGMSGPTYVGSYTYTWEVYALGGNGSYLFDWEIDYDDNSQYDDEWPSETGPELTFTVDAAKGDFTIRAGALTYGDYVRSELQVGTP